MSASSGHWRPPIKWWAANRSPDEAARWFNGFIEALESLGDNPRRWALAPENDAFPYEVRQLNFGLRGKPTHRALYTIRPDMVYVLLVRHLAQAPITPEDLES